MDKMAKALTGYIIFKKKKELSKSLKENVNNEALFT